MQSKAGAKGGVGGRVGTVVKVGSGGNSMWHCGAPGAADAQGMAVGMCGSALATTGACSCLSVG